MLQPIVHYSLHLLFPFLIAWLFYKDRWKFAYLVLLATMIIDVDHLLASPVFDPNRCSIGFHPLHSYVAMAVYFLFLVDKRTRLIGVGLLLHIATDYLDCLWMK